MQIEKCIDLHMDRKVSRIYVKNCSTRVDLSLENRKTAARIAASEESWRLPSSPIVEKKHVVFLCKFERVLIYTWIVKPVVLLLQFFGNTKMKTKKWPYTINADRKSAPLRGPGGSRRRQ